MTSDTSKRFCVGDSAARVDGESESMGKGEKSPKTGMGKSEDAGAGGEARVSGDSGL